jgi:DNA-binding beta-propeller fold protein YncE
MAADGEQAREAEPKARVFISYSRKDMAFADRLDTALKARGFEPLIDREEIYAFEDWWKRLQALITRADTVAFVISPDAVASREALKEVEYAASLNKRFAPIVCRRAEDSATPEALRRLNFIFFDDPAQFEGSADQLAEALRTDIGWIRQHTEFGEAARRWSVAGRPGPRGLLLRSPALEEAEHWIATRPANAPAPTEAVHALIAESRRAATKRRNIISGSLTVGLFVALGLAGLALWQRGIAVEQRGIAERNEVQAKNQRDRALVTQSRFLAAAGNQRINDGDAATGMLLASEAMLEARTGDMPAHAPEADRALLNGRNRLLEFAVLKGHEGEVRSAAFSPDGARVVTASSDHTVRIWDAASGKEIIVFKGHEDAVRSAAFSPDGARVVTASSDNTARIWDAASGKEIIVLKGHERGVTSAAYSPDGARVVTASSDETARIWNAASGKEIIVLKGHKDAVRSAAFSPDGARVVTASSDHTVRIWDAASGKEIIVLKGHEREVTSAAFSPDGARVVTSSGAFLLLKGLTSGIWDAASGQVITVLKGHEGGVTSAAFSPDGSLVITGSEDKTARIWDAASGKEMIVLKGHEDVVVSVAFSPVGARVVTASSDETARIWRVFSETATDHIAIDDARNIVPRCLTRARREQVFLDPEPPAWCIEMEKWPYHTQDWKDWLKFKRADANPPLPDTLEWQALVALRSSDFPAPRLNQK